MATQAERITALEVHYEHVDKTLTAMNGTLDAIRGEFAEFRTRIEERFNGIEERFNGIDDRFNGIDERFNGIYQAIADDKVERSETKLRVAFKVIGWLAGVIAAVMGAVVGGLFVFGRFLLPKLGELASLAQDTAPLVG